MNDENRKLLLLVNRLKKQLTEIELELISYQVLCEDQQKQLMELANNELQGRTE